jgi:hypothetical protein
MGPPRVVLSPLHLQDHLGFFEGVEDFAVEQLVSELAVELFTVTVLPGAAGLNVALHGLVWIKNRRVPHDSCVAG